jgi:hypothetical protein
LTGRKIHKLFFKLLRSEGQAKAGIETGSNKPYKKEFGSGMGSSWGSS